MKPQTIKSRVFFSFFMIILPVGICTFFLGLSVVRKDIVGRAQNQVDHDLDSAHAVFEAEVESLKSFFEVVSFDGDIGWLKEKLGLDYIYFITGEEALSHKSSIVRRAYKEGTCGGTRIIGVQELESMPGDVALKSRVEIMHTPKARQASLKVLEDAMAIEYARTVNNKDGRTVGVVYGGKIINRDFELVDKISNLVFENRMYDSKPIGTVTIFQDDIRIATNVLGIDGKRAVGTRVSEIVYNQVVGLGESWYDRAFVVTDWYLTAYEPIRNIDGDIIGILYVGTLEKPFTHMVAKLIIVFLGIGILAVTFGGWLSYVLGRAIQRPVKNLLDATQKISGGDLGAGSASDTSIVELNQLAESFNEMSMRLAERDNNLKITNEKLEESNKSYIDLIGFVAHELKGLLASAIMNAYSLRDGYLGMINFKQQRAINSITRNLDYLTATVKKFLNLNQIQKGEMDLAKKEINLKSEIYDVSIETFSNQFNMKKIEVVNEMNSDLVVNADAEMMMIVANNLISNAAKYGICGGKVEVKSAVDRDMVTVEVYNDSRPITEEAKLKLFKKFSRLDVPERKTVKGTGLGLYITKEIIEAHGGKIEAVPRENGNSFIFQIERGM